MVPTLGIYAGRPLASREAVLSHFPNAEYTQIPGSGHFLMLEKPQEFNRLLLAWASLSGPGYYRLPPP
jgi:pimeloyl-ACP methyl ester carboxylesterase